VLLDGDDSLLQGRRTAGAGVSCRCQTAVLASTMESALSFRMWWAIIYA